MKKLESYENLSKLKIFFNCCEGMNDINFNINKIK